VSASDNSGLLVRRDSAANAPHELQTPLTVISRFLENLIDSPLTLENHRRPIQLMSRQAMRMRSIIEDLLTLSRLEMGYTTTQSEPVDVPDTLRSILDEAKFLDAGKHALSEDIAPDLLLRKETSSNCTASFPTCCSTPLSTRR